MLHAARLGLTHLATESRMARDSSPGADFKDLLAKLSGRGGGPAPPARLIPSFFSQL